VFSGGKKGMAMMTWQLGVVCGLAAWGLAMAAGGAAADDGAARARRFVERYDATVRPLEVDAARCWWTANVSGRDEDYRRKEEAETRLELRLADPQAFVELKVLRQAGLGDPLLSRAIEVLYLSHLSRQVDHALLAAMVAQSNAVEKQFNLYRARVDGKELTDSQVRDVLKASVDPLRRRAVWEASKGVGSIVEPGLLSLVKLRNQAAGKLGFPDYHAMQLALGEQDRDQVLKLFDELDQLTRAPFHAVKAQIDAELSRRYGVDAGRLRPWHYPDPFFQEAPSMLGSDLESLFSTIDIPKIARDFYAGIGLPVDDILKRSDLYERPGKSPHGFCMDVDREGDVRVLVNLVPNRQWLATMVHELGHGVYSSKNIPRALPYALRADAHPLCTEGVAMMFERFVDNPRWLQALGVRVPDPERFRRAAAGQRRRQLLVFSRWCQVMFRFERELYRDPHQDLRSRWWDLVERYQEIRRPEDRQAPDYAAKIHLVLAPAYYHNYMLGEMFASQVHHAIVRDVLGGGDPAEAIYVGNPAAGEFMKRRVFEPGRTLDWNRLTRHATGQDLGAKALAEDIREE
jgi:peptidyl-dipeptidase A